jgi:uncharacterized protein (TIGR02646 family)
VIKIFRPEKPSIFFSPKLMRAQEDIKNNYNTRGQGRFKFDMSVLQAVRPFLMDVFKRKCAYCESPLGISSDMVVENFRPKNGSRGLNKDYDPDHYYWLVYEWENLLPACPLCNKYKRDVFPVEDNSPRAPIGATGDELNQEKYLLIDPCYDNPAEHLLFDSSGAIQARSLRGEVTIEVLGLNRDQLVHERKRAGQLLIARVEAARKSDGGEMKQYLDDLFSMSPPQEYAATLRAVCSERRLDLLLQDGKPDKSRQTENPYGIEFKITDVKFPVQGSFQIKTTLKSKLTALKRFTIKSIEICNFRTIDKLELSLISDQANDRESWLLLLGDNGIGKSSILQAIALTLAGRPQINKLGVRPADILRSGADSGYIKVFSYESGDPVELHFNKKRFTKVCKEPVSFLLGYGATRLLPKGHMRANRYQQDYLNIGNLFDYSAALTNVNNWLSEVATTEFQQRIAPALFDLLDMKKGERVLFENGRLGIIHNNSPVDISKTSDGYKSIVALACDIMKTLSLDNASYHSTQGIVLIDELGNHLHPRWRMKIAGALRNAFPQLQFIVSTHEPLCLRGLMHGEVVVLVRDSQNKVRALDKDLLPDHNLLRIDQLLTSDFFGLINTWDPETERKYEDYYTLLAKPDDNKNAGDIEKINELSKELANKEMIGPTPQMQVLYKVVNETYAKNLREDGFKTREELKAETVDQVKSILDDKNLDWL